MEGLGEGPLVALLPGGAGLASEGLQGYRAIVHLDSFGVAWQEEVSFS